MLLARIAAIALIAALPVKVSTADTVVAHFPACSDRSRAVELYDLLASSRLADAKGVFGAGVRQRTCRILAPGEIIAILSHDGLVRLLSFTGRDKLWTSWQAIARCDARPDWLPSSKYWPFSWRPPNPRTQRAPAYALEVAPRGRGSGSSGCPPGAHQTPTEVGQLVEQHQRAIQDELNSKSETAAEVDRDPRESAPPSKPHRASRGATKKGPSGLRTSGY